MTEATANHPTAVVVADQADAAATWKLSDTGSRIEFAVKNFWGLMTVRGRFDAFDAEAVVGGSGAVSASLTIDATSLDTGNRKRDVHLRSNDFFAVDSNPTITFVTREVTHGDGGRARVVGDLTVAGHTEVVEVDTTLAANGNDATADAEVTLDRTRFGMNWSPLGMASTSAVVSVHLRFAR